MSDVEYMQECLALAHKGRYTTHPNPLVGCVIVKDDVIVGRGFHERAGEDHAEIRALKEAGVKAQGATLYVNLEPCCHKGRTAPCVEAIINAGIKKVVVAMEDPNPLVCSGGIKKLRAAKIDVIVGVLAEQAQVLNRAFVHYITQKIPFVIGKWAMSLDGQMKTPNPVDRQLSSAVSREDTHELRQCTQAILIGSQTARVDNPSLTVRFPEMVYRQPQRIVLNTRADLDPTSRLFNGDLPDKTWLVCSEAFYPTAQKRFDPKTTEIIPVSDSEQRINIPQLLKILGEREIISVLVEGGRMVLQEFFKIKAVDEIICYVTPWFVGDLPYKLQLRPLEAEACGPDIKIRTVFLGD